MSLGFCFLEDEDKAWKRAGSSFSREALEEESFRESLLDWSWWQMEYVAASSKCPNSKAQDSV